MNQDGVISAFEMIFEEIANVQKQLHADVASASSECRYDRVDEASNLGKKILKFREKLEELRDEWKSEINGKTRQRIRMEPSYDIPRHRKGRRKTLRVTLPTGRVIQHNTAAQTFADVIEEIGIAAIQKLNLTVTGVPLVDIKQDRKYQQAKRGSYFICTHSSTNTKKDLLQQIGRGLDKALKVEVV